MNEEYSRLLKIICFNPRTDKYITRVLMAYNKNEEAIGCYDNVQECADGLGMTTDGIRKRMRRDSDGIKIKWICLHFLCI